MPWCNTSCVTELAVKQAAVAAGSTFTHVASIYDVMKSRHNVHIRNYGQISITAPGPGRTAGICYT